MLKAGNLRNRVMTVLLALAVTTPALMLPGCDKPEEQPLVGDELLRIIPAESLFCIRINNFDYAAGTMDRFLAGASPMPTALATMARMKLAGIFGSPDLKGINMGGNFAIFGALLPGASSEPKPEDIFVGILVPIADHKEFIDGNPNVTEPDSKGISKILGQFAAKKTGDYVLITKDYEKLQEAAAQVTPKSPGLANTITADLVDQALTKPAWVYANIELVSKNFSAKILKKFDEMEEMMAQAQKMGQPQIVDPGAIISIYAKIVEAFLKQTDSVTLAVDPQPNVLTITKTVTALPGTAMADVFTGDPAAAQENKLLNWQQDGSVMNFSADMSRPFWKKLNAQINQCMASLTNASTEDTEKMTKIVQDWTNCIEGPVVTSFRFDSQPKSPFSIRYFLRVKDTDKFNEVLEATATLANTGLIADFYKKLGMKMDYTMKPNADSYNGISISQASLVIRATDPNSPSEQMLRQMYGDGFEYRWAIVDGFCVFAVGGDTDSAVRKLIDQAKAGGPTETASEIKAALELMPGAAKADFMATYNYIRLFKFIKEMGIIPIPLPKFDFPTKSNLLFAGSAADGKFTLNIALPKQHLTEIVTAVTQAMQQMQQMSQPPPQIQPGQKPPAQ